jgi:TolB-like protein
MKRTARLFCFLMLAAAAPPLFGQAAAPAIVVLTFENGGSYGLDSMDFVGLGRGISAALTSDLRRNAGLRTLDRMAAQQMVERDGLSRGGRVDATAATRVGKQLGATYVVTGTFVDYYGRVRIDARLIDTSTGTILEVVSTGQRARSELAQMVSDIASQLMSGKRLPALPAGTPASAKVSSEALVLFGRAVLAQDQGDKAAAVQFYQQALKLSPDFAAATDGLRAAQAS